MESRTRTIGKNTIGDNNKMKVDLKTYNRSTNDLGYIWRNTQTVGTLVPFMCEVGQRGDVKEVDLMAKVLTHPTVGPLFGSFKFQADVFVCPIRLYNAWLHNNKLGISKYFSCFNSLYYFIFTFTCKFRYFFYFIHMIFCISSKKIDNSISSNVCC